MARNIFITGVSSGIGFGLAKACLAQGDIVYGVSRRNPPEIADHACFHFCHLDLSRFEEIIPSTHELLAPADELHLAILNAGVLGKIADLAATSLEEIKRVMDVNLWANKLLIDSLLKSGKAVQQVVAISSGAAVNANRGWNGYSISKAALNMLVALYAAEFPATHFCALAPGIVDTPMQEQISGIPADPRFPSLEFLRDAKGTPLMPVPDDAAPRLLDAVGKAVKYPSGSFLDMNSLSKRSWKI